MIGGANRGQVDDRQLANPQRQKNPDAPVACSFCRRHSVYPSARDTAGPGRRADWHIVGADVRDGAGF